MNTHKGDGCVLMFSGGRDSTIAAVRLAKLFSRLTLVTVLGDHLIGIERVYQRVCQLRRHLTGATEWLKIAQPVLPITKPLLGATCLPCQRAYVSIGAILAQRFQVSNMAMGYSGYQSSWPEQTPYATARLRELLAGFGIRLHLPVYDILKKEDAVRELMRLGLAHESYEQKCLKQSSNIELGGDALKSEIDAWIECISEIIRSKDTFAIDVSVREKIGDITLVRSHLRRR